MNYKNRGKCIIFNHDRFDFTNFSQREGSSLDAKRLEVTFGNLGFDVEVYDDFTHSEVMDMLQDGLNPVLSCTRTNWIKLYQKTNWYFGLTSSSVGY
ncbi:PREDICTED: caspase-1-like [Vollenhovia emeryi]|uniref:caspase-1-like n=1 Tax=Vollenhovia emeryi TaxID=411798 RepID=UPI0005F5025A|nr:PREDICTED: caspase-1-like [Vollenhovia emeryi]